MTYTKRAVALLLALMMVFTGAVQAFAATQMTMAVIALPRAADTIKAFGAFRIPTFSAGGEPSQPKVISFIARTPTADRSFNVLNPGIA